jgi:hypothetical protein
VIRIQEGERDFHLSATNLLNLGLVDALKWLELSHCRGL